MTTKPLILLPFLFCSVAGTSHWADQKGRDDYYSDNRTVRSVLVYLWAGPPTPSLATSHWSSSLQMCYDKY